MYSASRLNKERSYTILAGDIGATKMLLAVFNVTDGKLSCLREQKFITKECNQIEDTIKQFVGIDEIPLVSLGVAGPVIDGKVNITNISRILDRMQISALLNNIPVYFINDLEATAYGLSELKPEDFKIILEGKPNLTGNIAVIAPGTGLGEAAAYWDGTNHYPFATEGGHCDFAARSEVDFELQKYLSGKFGHVSWERVISGPGIENIFGFLQTKKQMIIPEWLQKQLTIADNAEVISANTEVDICREAMNLFFRYLATEAANLTLKTKATGGIFIGGGIITKVLPLLDTNVFMQHFTDFGRLKFLLKEVPVTAILNSRTALLGAAVFGAGLIKN